MRHFEILHVVVDEQNAGIAYSAVVVVVVQLRLAAEAAYAVVGVDLSTVVHVAKYVFVVFSTLVQVYLLAHRVAVLDAVLFEELARVADDDHLVEEFVDSVFLFERDFENFADELFLRRVGNDANEQVGTLQ